MRMMFSKARRVVVYNFASGFGPVSNCKPNQNKLPGFQFAYSVPELIAILSRARRGAVRVCFSPLRTLGDKKDIFNDVCRLVCDFSEAYGATVFAVDEIWNAQTPSWSPDALNEAILQWRHYDLTLLWTAQRPQKTDATLRGMSTELYCGRLTTQLDLDAVKDCGFSSEAMALIPSLPNRKFVHRFDTGVWKVERS
jgi:hypothetical protein